MKGRDFFYRRYFGSGNALQTERIIELVTIGLAIVLLVQLLLSGARLVMLSAPDAILPTIGGMTDAQLMSVEMVGAAQSDEIRERPLFWVSRRPVEFAEVGEEAAVNSAANRGMLKNVKLVGLFGGGEVTGIIAIVKGKKRRILLGEQVEGWTLDSVERNEVVFVHGTRSEKLILLPQKYVAPPVTSDPGRRGPIFIQGGGGAKNKAQELGPVTGSEKDKAGEPPPSLGFGGGGRK
jgi:hypothetical protein